MDRKSSVSSRVGKFTRRSQFLEVNKALTSSERDEMLNGLDEAIETIKVGIDIFRGWAEKNKEDVDKFAVLKSGYLGLVTSQNGLELYQGNIRLVDQEGKQLELFDSNDYLSVIAEHVEDWSYLKFPYYKKLGWPAGVYRVGPLGRLNAVDHIDTPQANEALFIVP